MAEKVASLSLDESSNRTKKLRILSWNLLHRNGAVFEDIQSLVEKVKPDLFLMQEVTREIDVLGRGMDGNFHWQQWAKRRHGLAIWCRHQLENVAPLELPYSKIPGSFPQRSAQFIQIDGITIANVHLSHGQVMNRKQLRKIASSTSGPTAIIGDYNAVGPTTIKDFKDVGPRNVTHFAQKVVPFRLDRCLVRELECTRAKSLNRGRSDHKPILLELTKTASTNQAGSAGNTG